MKKTLVLFFLLLHGFLFAQNYGYNLSEITRDLMIADHHTNEMSFVWWLPPEYWQILFEQQFTEPNESASELTQVLKSYNIFAVMKGEIDASGNVDYRSADEIQDNIIYTDAVGNMYFPQESTDIDYRLLLLFTSFKPVFAQTMGQYGENINMVVFDVSQNPASRPKPTQAGRFYMSFFDKDYSFRLPVGSFLPPKYCPKDGEKMKGHWNYCPFHGDKLVDEFLPR